MAYTLYILTKTSFLISKVSCRSLFYH